MMVKYIIGGLGLFVSVLSTVTLLQQRKLVKTQQALDHATAYIQASKGVDNATSNLPTDNDSILAELCRIAGGGKSCSDSGSSTSTSD